MTWHLRKEQHLVNTKRIRRLMRLMGLVPFHQKPKTGKAAKCPSRLKPVCFDNTSSNP